MKKTLMYILAFLIGLLPGFFLVFNYMFSDVSSDSERSVSFLVVEAVYLFLGAVFGLLVSDKGWKYALCLSLPALMLIVLYSLRETGTILINLSYAVSVLGSALIGSLAGRLKYKKKQ
jgi:hypothetical protein